ncbi:hypothetical protein [Paenibacillus sp. R14(2021)]|uniref:hypothetical protein n=1 Tax=Paenibacillus sp. R14(2021) TaxID=2859228 RepID=UPI001C6137E8|nr:hypothetical protein [Paenibacillus sp. R14(2021)]
MSMNVSDPSDKFNALTQIYKPHLLSIAHRMLGSSADAELTVRHVLQSHHELLHAHIHAMTAELTKKTINHCLNELRSVPKKGFIFVEAVNRLITALSNADMGSIEELMADDVVLIADGGGKVSVVAQPITGKTNVSCVLHGITTAQFPASRAKQVTVNGRQGILITQEGAPMGVVCLEWDPLTLLIQQIYIVANPDKLRHIRLT